MFLRSSCNFVSTFTTTTRFNSSTWKFKMWKVLCVSLENRIFHVLFPIYTGFIKVLPISAFCEAFLHTEPWEGGHQSMACLQRHHLVTVFFALQEGTEMKKLIALRFPYTPRFALNASNKKTTETLRGQIWLRCSHIDERSTEEGLGALLLMDASTPDISFCPFTSRNICSCYHFSSRQLWMNSDWLTIHKHTNK